MSKFKIIKEYLSEIRRQDFFYKVIAYYQNLMMLVVYFLIFKE